MSFVRTPLSTPHGEIALYDTGGPGQPILLLHGVGATLDVFSNQFQSPLAGMFRLIAIDLPGHGASSDATDPEAVYRLPALADTAATVLRQLGIDRALVYGWSMGGHIAMEMAHRHASMLSGLMLTGAPPIAHGPLASLRAFHTSWQMLLASKEHFSDRDAASLERFCFDEAADGSHIEAILRSDGRFRSMVNRSLRRGDFADQKRIVETTSIPLAMVNGAREPAARLAYVDNLHYSSLWEQRCHVIPEAGHAPFLTRPNAFNALLHRFASDIALRERSTPAYPHRNRA